MKDEMMIHGQRMKKSARMGKILLMMVLSVIVVNVLMYLSTMITGKPIENGIFMDISIPVLCAFMMI
ncbi:MAG: hypothetical protein J5842_08010 [Lachnospiraceae bacterium]|nr:hypothetical protein [Lachnospiraceae bacterium]